VSVSLSLEMIKILLSFNFYNFRYSGYSGNRNFVCGFVVLYIIFIVVYGMLRCLYNLRKYLSIIVLVTYI
jgi:hypothetical protein